MPDPTRQRIQEGGKGGDSDRELPGLPRLASVTQQESIMKTRRLIVVCTLGLVGTAPAFAAAFGEGSMWTDLINARQASPAPHSAAVSAAERGGLPEISIYDQLAAQHREFRAQRPSGVAGRSGADVETGLAVRDAYASQNPEESIYDRLIRQRQ